MNRSVVIAFNPMKAAWARHRSIRRSAAALLILCAPAVLAQADGRFPSRKPGLWETSTEVPGGGRSSAAATMRFQQCVDSKTDEAAQRRQFSPDPGARCTTSNVRTGSGEYEADYACDSAGGKVSGHVKMSGDLSSRYTLTNTMRREPAPASGPAERTVTILAQHQGDCPADMKPGDTRMSGMPQMPGGMPQMPSGSGPMTREHMQQMIEQMKRGGSGR